MKSLMGLLIALRAAGVRLETDAEGLHVDAPVGALTEALREAIQQHKAALLCLPLPYMNDAGELIVPSYAPPQYHWQPHPQTWREIEKRSESLVSCKELTKNQRETTEYHPKNCSK